MIACGSKPHGKYVVAQVSCLSPAYRLANGDARRELVQDLGDQLSVIHAVTKPHGRFAARISSAVYLIAWKCAE